MMKKIIVFIFGILSLSTYAQNIPYPNHSSYLGTHIKPNIYTQAQLDKQCSNFYELWKAKYIKSCTNGEYYVYTNGPDNVMTVSEGHGYGMLIMALMAGYDTDAKSYFDGMVAYYDKHRSSINNLLMSWQQTSCNTATQNDDAATDGDVDIAFALLLADKQWGSSGNINYLQKAKDLIVAIMDDEINTTHLFVKLGDWASNSNYHTRTSDFICDHYRNFAKAVKDTLWNSVVDECYFIIQTIQKNESPQTGLLPDFVKQANKTPMPDDPFFLESQYDGDYYYNACRTPWRLTSDYLISGEMWAKYAVTKIENWIKSSTNNNPDKISNGYKLDGTKIYNWGDAAFIAPFMVGAMVDSSYQTWLNKLYDYVLSENIADLEYYENTIKMLCMIVVSGNYWTPYETIATDHHEENTDSTSTIRFKPQVSDKFSLRYNNKYLYISVKDASLHNANIYISNLSGKICYRNKMNFSEQKIIHWNNRKQGIYFVILETEKKRDIQKFVSF